MKKNRFFFCLPLLALSLLLLAGCKKSAPPATPETPDAPGTASAPGSLKEVQCGLDVTWATYVITDLEQMCAFMGENELFNHFYMHVQGTPGVNQVSVERNVQAKDFRMLFNDTRCVDGRFRQGTVFVRYAFDPVRKPGANPNSEYYDEYGFVAQLSLMNYRVDGWLVENYDPNVPAYIYNEIESLPYDSKTTKLKWQIAGKFKFTRINDSVQRSIVWDGQIFKTLENTSNTQVYSTNRLTPVNWALAVCSYSGKVKGVKNSDEQFEMEVGTLNNPLVRDFACAPDQGSSAHHPFVKGISTFTAGSVYPCNIYFGNEGNPSVAHQCDSVGTILITGKTYNVIFAK